MFAITFRVSGAYFDVEKFLAISHWQADVIWMKGSENKKGQSYDTSGLSISIDEGGIEQINRDLHEFFIGEQNNLNVLANQGLVKVVDIGFTINSADLMPSIKIDVPVLQMLVRNEVQLEISVYPLDT